MMRPVMGESAPQIVSVEENLILNSINIHPNPADQFIQISGFDIEPELYEIYDLSGRIIRSETFNSNINVSRLQSGIYYIRFIMENNIIANKKIVIQ